jgi:uncharacterized protein (DUF3820 family)
MRNFYSEYKYTKMPFGEYKGCFMKDIPDSYLDWLIVNIQDKAFITMLNVEKIRRQRS